MNHSRDVPPHTAAPDEDGTDLLAPGSRVGRYLVLECIGQGSMGQVYSAFDPVLDRKVAVKMLRVGESDGNPAQTESESRIRLMREAKALSQLAHPNVVAVHDVGTQGDGVFLAMEYVAGTDLRQWSKDQPRSWQQVLEVYIQAGRGLAAAHAAGLVHRDFKPQNAVLGSDGRVRVLDFGLASTRDPGKHGMGAASILDRPIRSSGSRSDSWEKLTHAGALLGTPAYMAPEVILGNGADEKSDQFSYCVSLFQALYGCRPFEGSSLQEIRQAIAEERVVQTRQHVPGWLRKAVLRGLSAEASHRFPSMEALLFVLERRAPSTRRLRWTVRSFFLAAASTVLALVFLQASDRATGLCHDANRNLVDIWDSGRKAAVRKALVATGVPYAQDTWRHVRASLDDYTHGWVTMHQDACEATHVRGEQSGDLLDLRMRCLKERLGEVKALVDVLSRADADMVQKAVPSTRSLVVLSSCADENALRSAVPPPRNAETAQQVESIRQRLEHARALERTGKFVDGMMEVDGLEAQTRALGYSPLVAEVLLLKGVLLSDLGKYPEAVAALEEADLTASIAKHVIVTAQVQQPLVHVVGFFMLKLDEALLRARYARVILQQGGLFGTLGGGLLEAVGNALARNGEPEKAMEQLQSSLQLCTQSSGEDGCSATMLALATANYAAGHVEEGERLFHRTIAIMEKTLGTTHPNLGRAMNNYGVLLIDLGKGDEAMKWLQRARSVYEQSVGKEHPISLDNLNNIGNAHWLKGKFEQARKTHERVLEMRIRVLGPTHYSVGSSYINLGSIYLDMGQLDLAQFHMEKCLEVRTSALGPEHDKTIICLAGLGAVAAAKGRYELAEPMLEKALSLWSRTRGPDHPTLHETLVDLGKVAHAQRNWQKANTHLEHALRILDKNRIVNKFTVMAHLHLAQVLWETASRRSEAMQHARQASELVARLNVKYAVLAAEIARWLETHKQ